MRVLNFPRFSLAFLLKHYCGITVNKAYQLADWRYAVTWPLNRCGCFATPQPLFALHSGIILFQTSLCAYKDNLLHLRPLCSPIVCYCRHVPPKTLPLLGTTLLRCFLNLPSSLYPEFGRSPLRCSIMHEKIHTIYCRWILAGSATSQLTLPDFFPTFVGQGSDLGTPLPVMAQNGCCTVAPECFCCGHMLLQTIHFKGRLLGCR